MTPFDAAARAREIALLVENEMGLPLNVRRSGHDSIVGHAREALRAAHAQGDAAGYARGIEEAAKKLHAVADGTKRLSTKAHWRSAAETVRALAAGDGTGGAT